MSYYINCQDLPVGMYWKIVMWMNDNNIGNTKEQIRLTQGEVNRVELSEEEYLMLLLRFTND